MKEMTLREVCEAYGVSRRAVQGYEKAKLLTASGKNKYGHLLYDDVMQERIRRIRLFQQMGFTIREIQGIIDAPAENLKSALGKQVKKLEKERDDMTELIQEMYRLIKTL